MDTVAALIVESADKGVQAGRRILDCYGIAGEFVATTDHASDREAGIDGYLRLGDRRLPVGMRFQHCRPQGTVTFRDTTGGELSKRRAAAADYPNHLTLHSYWWPDRDTFDSAYLVRTADAVANLAKRVQVNPEDGHKFRFARACDVTHMGCSRWEHPPYPRLLPSNSDPARLAAVAHVLGARVAPQP